MVDIEPATGEDVDAVTDQWVDLAAGQRAFGSHLLADENRTHARATVARSVVTDELLVARDGEVVGFVTFGVESGAFEQDTVRGVVRNVYVDPDRRGEGIGTALLSAAETALVGRGAETFALEAMAENEAARRFYRRHGYRPQRVEMEKQAESDTLTKG